MLFTVKNLVLYRAKKLVKNIVVVVVVVQSLQGYLERVVEYVDAKHSVSILIFGIPKSKTLNYLLLLIHRSDTLVSGIQVSTLYLYLTLTHPSPLSPSCLHCEKGKMLDKSLILSLNLNQLYLTLTHPSPLSPSCLHCEKGKILDNTLNLNLNVSSVSEKYDIHLLGLAPLVHSLGLS